MRRSKPYLSLPVFWCFMLFLHPLKAQEIQSQPFFSPGEKLTYELSWKSIPAGISTLQVLPIETIQNVQSYHFLMTTATNSFIDLFYKIRYHIEGYTDLKMTHTLLYKRHQQEGSRHKNIVVSFDWKEKKAQYESDGEKRNPIPLLPESFDPLSIIYYMRTLDLKENLVIEKPVTDGKKNVLGKAVVLKRETIQIKDKIYDTYLLEPELKNIGGVFRKSKNAKIQLWVTADQQRIPVRVKSKVVIGEFVGELVSTDPLYQPSAP